MGCTSSRNKWQFGNDVLLSKTSGILSKSNAIIANARAIQLIFKKDVDEMRRQELEGGSRIEFRKLSETQEQQVLIFLYDIIAVAKKNSSDDFLDGQTLNELLIVQNMTKMHHKTSQKLREVLKVAYLLVEKKIPVDHDSISDKWNPSSNYNEFLGGTRSSDVEIHAIGISKASDLISFKSLKSKESNAFLHRTSGLGAVDNSSHNSLDSYGFFDISTHSARGPPLPSSKASRTNLVIDKVSLTAENKFMASTEPSTVQSYGSLLSMSRNKSLTTASHKTLISGDGDQLDQMNHG